METTNGHSHVEKRVVTFFIWDPELDRKIDCEVKMIDGISKLLNVATTLEQTIQCHKALILSQQRMLAFMNEIKRKQQNLLKLDTRDLEPTKATVILSDLRLPLIWDNFKAKPEQKQFAVFGLARVGCEIIDTEMKFINKKSTEILFSDKLNFDNVPHDFQLHLEIYALNQTLALSSSAKDFADRYSYFSTHGSPKLARKVPETASINSKPSNEQQSKFVLIARTRLTKQSVYKMAKVRCLTMERSQENSLMQLPIHSSFIGRFVAQPLCYTRLATFAGIVEIYHVRYSCTLTAGFLNGEEIMRDDYSDQHRFSIPITSDTVISFENDHLAFSVFNRGFDQEEFVVQDLFTLNNWVRALQQHIVDIQAWQYTFEHLPSIRRSSHQPLISSPISSIRGRTLIKKSTKARSLDNLHQTNSSSEPVITSRIDQSKNTNNIVDCLSTDEDDDDDDDISVYHTKL